MKPNVLFIIDSFEQGGSERQALQLLRQLHESGRVNVRLACLQDKGSLKVEAEKLGIGEIHEYPLTSFHDLNFLKQLRRFIRAERETFAVLQCEGDRIPAGHVIEPAEAAHVNAPAFKRVRAHLLRVGDFSERHALSDQSRTKAPAQFTVSDFNGERVKKPARADQQWDRDQHGSGEGRTEDDEHSRHDAHHDEDPFSTLRVLIRLHVRAAEIIISSSSRLEKSPGARPCWRMCLRRAAIRQTFLAPQFVPSTAR